MRQPMPGTMKFETFVNEIKKGSIKIPQFQRDFVWDKKQSAALLDSLIKGYPIGTFILWKTRERLRSIKDIGAINLPEPPEGDSILYVLDGQQRMTSLFACLTGANITQDDKKVDYSEIYFDLLAEEDDEIVITEIAEKEAGTFIKITELITGGFSLATKYAQEYHPKLDLYRTRMTTYDFSTIQIEDVPINVATEIFTRINVGGKALTVFEIMVAKTFDAESDFDLAKKYDELMERLETVNYETIPSSTVLQAVSVCMVKDCSKRQLLKLDKKAFIEIWPSVLDALERTVDYFKSFYRIPVSQLLPYDGLLIPFTYFFYNHKDRPIGIKQKYLQDYFWRTVLNSRFSNSLETKVGQDIRKIDLILNDELPKYEEGVNITNESIIESGWFSAGRAYIKGLLCLLAHEQPQSFADGSKINIDNGWLKQVNSKNYHHFFPRAYLRKKGEDDFYINHIANITIVDDFLNKREIKDNPPSKYMTKFLKTNSELSSAMKTHLINDITEYGVWEDNYDLFFQKRVEAICRKLKKRLVLVPNDIVEEDLPCVIPEKNINGSLSNIEKMFDDAMWNIYKTAKKELGYNASRFFKLLSEKKGVQAAKILIAKDGGTYGFEVLWEHKRLGLSIEAHVIKPEFKELFSEAEIEQCRNRLKDFGYMSDV